MKRKLSYLFLAISIAFTIASCDKGVGCPNDKYNNWKEIEARRKQQMKNPSDPNKSKKKSKSKVYGIGVVP